MRFRIMQNEDGNNDVERLFVAEDPAYNWRSVGPGGCDSHCIEHPCGPCRFGSPRAQWVWVATFKDIAHAKKFCPEAETPTQCGECLEVIDGSSVCEECCEHGDMDGTECLDCGTDRAEDMMAAAYDRAKAARQDQ